MIRSSVILALLLCGLVAIGNAQNNSDISGTISSPDAPGVARLSFVRGDVSMQRGDPAKPPPLKSIRLSNQAIDS